MKSILVWIIYAAIISQSKGCDIIKKITGREWHEIPKFTKGFMIFMSLWGLIIFTLIAIYLIAPSSQSKKVA
jgi:hypothetical protein